MAPSQLMFSEPLALKLPSIWAALASDNKEGERSRRRRRAVGRNLLIDGILEKMMILGEFILWKWEGKMR